jgi:hypothetical protein
MADLAVSAVTILRAWREGGAHGKEVSCRQVSMVLTGQGTAANAITAASLNLSRIEQVSNFVSDDDVAIYPAAVSADGSKVLLVNLAQGTDVDRTDPADITATLIGVVKGYL